MGLLEESKARAEALAGKGYDLCKYGKYKEALVLYRQACELDGDNYKYWYNAAVACDRIGDNAGMERACLKTIECDGTFIKGYVRLAKAHLRQDKLEEASEVIATGMLISDSSPDLKALKEQVNKKQEEKSMVAARQLEGRLRTAEPVAPAVRRVSDSAHSSSSGASSGSASGSAVTTVGGNPRHPLSPTRSPVSQKPNHVVNLLRNKRPPTGIPAAQREIPKLNNQFGDSPQPRPQREIPRLNNPHFGDSAPHRGGVHPLAVPASANRDDGPEFKDQCKTFIVAETAVQEIKQPRPREAAPKQPSRRRFFRKSEHEI